MGVQRLAVESRPLKPNTRAFPGLTFEYLQAMESTLENLRIIMLYNYILISRYYEYFLLSKTQYNSWSIFFITFQNKMLIGDIDYPVAEAAIFFVLILSIIFNTFLFRRGEGNYSIKYELMRNQEFFRKNICVTYAIEVLYKFFFALPFILLITLSILAAIRDTKNLAPILINGLIILLMLYPIKSDFYYHRLFLIMLLVIGSELSTFFIYEKLGEQAYLIISAIFYTANILFFYLALISIQKVYWDISQGIEQVKDEVSEVNNRWAQGQISKLFDGGLYGFFCRSNYPYFIYLVLYFVSLLFLMAYALIVHYVLGSKLGYVGLVSAIIYDIFVQIFNSLEHHGRSTKTVYFVLVLSRILSFVFGIENWLLGYCVLYFFVSVFIGWIIIDKRLPMKPQSKKDKQARVSFLNALKTPEFVLVVLTVEIIIMILVEAYALTEKDPTLTYNNVTIPIWQWGILVLVGAWVVIIYMLSVRVLLRNKYKIFNLTEYYFGIRDIREYHLYISLSYLLLIGLGIYTNLYLQDKIILTSCIFLPLLYLCLLAMWGAWTKNQYHVLADTEEYNKLMLKKQEAKIKRIQMIELNDKLKDKKKELMISNYTKGSGFGLASLKNVLSKKFKSDEVIEEGFGIGEMSGGDLNEKGVDRNDNVIKVAGMEIEKFVPLRDWRKPQEAVECSQIWSCLTPSDKKIIIVAIIFFLLSIGYCLTSMLWCQQKFAISLLVCVISYITLIPYVKYFETKEPMWVSEIIGNWLGFALGIAYWAAFDYEVVGPIAFSLGYIGLALFILIRCYRTQFSIRVLISPALQILLSIIFIEITLSVHKTIVQAVIFAIIFFVLVVLQVPLYYMLVHEYIPSVVIGICASLIGSTIITISVLGYVYKVLSSFAIFTIIMALIFIGFFAAAVAIYVHKYNIEKEKPNVYCAYGFPNYYFDSSKETLKPNNSHITLFTFSMITLVIYSVIVSVFFDQKEWAVFGLCLFWLMEFFVSMQTAMSCYIFLGQEKKKNMLTTEVIRESLLKLKNHYMADEIEGEDSPYFQKLLEEAKQKVGDGGDDAENWKEVVLYHDLYVKNVKEEERFIFFWIALIEFNVMAKKRQIVTQTLAELKSIEEELTSNGIILEALELNLKPVDKYEKVLKEIENLQPLDFMIYEQILENHREEMKKKKVQIEEAHQKQKEENDKRDEELYNEMNKRVTIDQKDQVEKFKQLLKSLGRRNLYCDSDFPANENSLGETLASVVDSWRRPTPEEVLTKGGITADDVRQGLIGDCYLVSSFAVLGEQRIKESLGYDANGNQVWVNDKGAYMVRFFKFSKEVYIIIDDLLPVNEQKQWVFAKSQEPTQYWPCILEKAYAKMYGGYNKIVEGKNHQVFAEFTGGFPYEIIINDYKPNPYGLWNQLITSKNNGYLLAAGSPPNINGDSVASKRGIVQGHAYSILDAKQVDEYRLIKLKNPHGSGGKEWIGDFSDKSDLMTKRMMSLLNHERTDDGIFWMTIEDFILEFKSMYVCAVFDETKWLKMGPINGQWTDDNSFGTPNNMGADKNPHYGIRVTKKCFLFVSLTQESVSALKGKNFIFMKAMKNKGKRISPENISSENSIGKHKRPIDSVSISLQLELEAEEYPYTFSLMVSCDKPGKTGSYTLLAYCNDKDAQIIDDSKFDREP